jgi:hypothetical protein
LLEDGGVETFIFEKPERVGIHVFKQTLLAFAKALSMQCLEEFSGPVQPESPVLLKLPAP